MIIVISDMHHIQIMPFGGICLQEGHRVKGGTGWYGGTLMVSGVTNKRRIRNAKYPGDHALFRSLRAARNEARDRVLAWKASLRSLEKELAKRKNDPCLCRSGKTYGECHGNKRMRPNLSRHGGIRE